MSLDNKSGNAEESRETRRRKILLMSLRVAAWACASLVAAVMVCIIALVTLVNRDGVHRYLIRLAEKEASERLGAQVQLENFAVHLNALSLDLYGIRVSGAVPYPNPPLLTAPHVRVGVRIVSIFGGEWYLNRLQIDRPVLWVVVDKRGISNLPKLKSNGTSQTDIFKLGVRHAVLDRGEVYYNSRLETVSADLHDLQFRSSFDKFRTMYGGRLAYSNGRLKYGSFAPWQHNLSVEFQATPSTFTLKRATITSGNSEAILSATVNGYSNPILQGQYRLKVDCEQVGKLLHEPSMPGGVVSTSGSIQYRAEPKRSLLEALAVSGEINSRKLRFRTDSKLVEAENVVAQYSLADGNATLQALRANVLGGELKAQGTMWAITGASHTELHAQLRKVSLGKIQQFVEHAAPNQIVAFSGTGDATAAASWGKTLDDMSMHVDATINGQMASLRNGKASINHEDNGQEANSGTGNATGNEASIPIDGEFHAVYTNNDRELRFDRSYIRTAQTNLTLDGNVGRHSSLTVDLQANDIGELAAIAESLRGPNAERAPLDLGGRASFQGVVQGPVADPHLSGQLAAEDVRLSGSEWETLRTRIELTPSSVDLQNVDLESQMHERISGNLQLGMRAWSISQDSGIEADIDASQVNIAELTKLVGQPIPITGILNARLRLHGSLEDPAGNGNITLIRATAYEQPVSFTRVDFSGSNGELQADLSVRSPAGTLRGHVTAEPQSRVFTAQIDSGGIDLAKLQVMRKQNIEATGLAAIHIRGNGSFSNPELDADVEIPSLEVSGLQISGMKFQVNVANHIANAEMNSLAAKTVLHAKAQVELSGDYLSDVSFDTQALPLQPLLAIYAPDEAADVSGETEIHATLHGPLKEKDKLEAQVTVPELKVGYGKAIQLAATSPIRVDYKEGTMHLQPATIRGTGTDVQIQGSIPIGGAAPMSLQAHGSVDLRLVQLLDPDLHSSGELKLNINSSGANAGGVLGGEIDVVNASLSSATLPIGLEDGNGVLKLTPDRVEVASFQGTVGGGSVRAQGTIVYRPNIQFNIGATAQGIRMLYPQGVRETVNANLHLGGTLRNSVLGGAVDVADLSFTPAFDLSTLSDQLSGGVAVPTRQGFAENLALNFAVNATNNINLVSRTLSIGGSANLQVRGTAADPVILGRVNLNSGDIIFNGNRFVLTGGTVQFINPSMTEPVVNVALTTTIQEYKIDLRFNGPVDQMRTQYSSNPGLPAADIINLLAFGQTTEASAMNAMPANQQAKSLVASQVSSQVTSRLSKAAGISQLSINPVLQNSATTGPPGAQLTIQQRVTGNLFVTFSTNVSTTQGQVIQGQYQLSPRVAVSATRDPNGGFAVDTLIKKSW